MTKTNFNNIIRGRWPELYWSKHSQYANSFTENGNIDTPVFMIFINYCDESTASTLMYSGDDIYEQTLANVIAYLEKNEDMIDWLLL